MATTLTTDLECYWNCNSNVDDSTANNYDGTRGGDAAYVSGGILGYCLDFSGAGWVTDFGSPLTSEVNFSVSLWFKSTQTVKGQFLTHYSGGAGDWLQFYISQPTVGDISFNPSTGRIQIAGSWNDGDWHHVVGTYENGYTETWIDGIKEGTNDSSPHTFSSGDYLIFGAYAAATGKQNYDGLLDEVGIWHKVLSDSEIAELYNSGDGLTYPFSTGPDYTVIEINIADVWKACAGMEINIGDAWKTVASVSQNIGDTWKTVF